MPQSPRFLSPSTSTTSYSTSRSTSPSTSYSRSTSHSPRSTSHSPRPRATSPHAEEPERKAEVPFWSRHRVAGFEADGKGGWREVVREVPQPRYPPPPGAVRPTPRHPPRLPLPSLHRTRCRISSQADSKRAEAGSEHSGQRVSGTHSSTQSARPQSAAERSETRADSGAGGREAAGERGWSLLGRVWGWRSPTRFAPGGSHPPRDRAETYSAGPFHGLGRAGAGRVGPGPCSIS